MITELIKLAGHLDAKGLRKEADTLDLIIRAMSEATPTISYQVWAGDSWFSIWEKVSSETGMTMEDNALLNGFDTTHTLQPCDSIMVYANPGAEDTAVNPNCTE